MAQHPIRGSFLWNELLTTDPGAAARFYGDVVGWKAQAWEGDSSYSMWMAPGGPAGGVMALPAEAAAMGAPPNWLPYIGTPDVAATVAAARRLGARVMKDTTEIPTVGHFAVVADPQGATFAAFTPSSAEGAGGAPGIGQFSWHELATTDHRAALDFYRELFGWEKLAVHDMGPMGEYLLFGVAGKQLGGMFDKPAEMPAPPHWLSYVRVEDVARTAARVSGAGGRLLMGPHQVPGGDWIAQILDPQGAAVALHSTGPAVASTPSGTRKRAAGKTAAARRKAAPKRKATPPRKARTAKKGASRRKAAAPARKGTSRRKAAPARVGAPKRRAAPRRGGPSKGKAAARARRPGR